MLSIFYLAILTRSLGVAGFGEFMVIVSAVQILSGILKFQTWQAVVQYGAPYILRGQDAAFRKLSRDSFLIELLGGLIACLILWLLLPFAAAHFGWSPAIERAIFAYGVVCFVSVRSTPIGILRAQDRFRGNALADAMIPIVRFVGSATLIFVAPTLTGFLIVWGLSELVSFLFLWMLVARNQPDRKPMADGLTAADSILPSETLTEQASLQAGSSHSGREGFFAYLLYTNLAYLVQVIRERLVVLIVGLLVSTDAAGLFRLADQLANSVNRLSEVFARPLFSELSRLYAGGQVALLNALFWRSFRASAISGAIIFAALLLLGKPLILLISGSEFLPAFPLLILLGAATIISLAGLGLEPLLQAADRARAALFGKVAGLLILAILMAMLLPVHGTIGTAWAMLISAISTTILLFWSGRFVIAQKAHLS